MTQPHKANQALIEDALFLFDVGVQPPLVAERLGVQLQTIRTNFWRAGIPWPFDYDNATRTFTRKQSDATL